MKRKVVRVVLALAVLGALAAIPASTQVVSPASSQATSKGAGGNLPMILVVNRLELSRTQMETLRTTIRGLLDEAAGLDDKRTRFETEMIAFNGTAEELDVRVAAFQSEMKAARDALRQKTAAAVDTLKETLTMKQGEILMNAFPGMLGRLGALTTGVSGLGPQAMMRSAATTVAATAPVKGRGQTLSRATTAEPAKTAPTTMSSAAASKAVTAVGMACGQSGMMQNGQMGMQQSGSAAVELTPGSAGVAGKVQNLVERIRDRVAKRLGASAPSAVTAVAVPTTEAAPAAPSSSTGMCPMRETMGMSMSSSAAPSSGSMACPMMGTMGMSQSPSAAPSSSGSMACPMMGTMSQAADSSAAGMDAVQAGVAANIDGFGVVTMSLTTGGSADATAMDAGDGRLAYGLERLLEVLELKLAAMP